MESDVHFFPERDLDILDNGKVTSIQPIRNAQHLKVQYRH